MAIIKRRGGAYKGGALVRQKYGTPSLTLLTPVPIPDTVFVITDQASGRGECRFIDVSDEELEKVFMGDSQLDTSCILNVIDAEGFAWNQDIVPVI